MENKNNNIYHNEVRNKLDKGEITYEEYIRRIKEYCEQIVDETINNLYDNLKTD